MEETIEIIQGTPAEVQRKSRSLMKERTKDNWSLIELSSSQGTTTADFILVLAFERLER